MLKPMTVAAALLLGVSTLALAQTTTSPGGSAPTAPSTAVSPSAPSSPNAPAAPSGSVSRPLGSSSSTMGSGTSAMSQADIKKQVEQQGYTQVQLHENTTGTQKSDWSGTAMKGGKQVNIHVDANGRVTQR